MQNFFAKTENVNGKTTLGMDVFTHCVIVGCIANALAKRWNGTLQDTFFTAGCELIAASHDIGKVTPAFQEKIHRALDNYEYNTYPGLEKANPALESEYGYHAGAGNSALQDCGKYISEIVGCHHGAATPQRNANAQFFGGEEWQKYRMELLEQLKKYFNVDFPNVDKKQVIVLSGLTCVADWIGSSQVFAGITHINEITDIQKTVNDALDNAGFIRPVIKNDLSFFDVFGFKPRKSQEIFFNATLRQGVYILEAPMGIGKTEAALYAAYKIMCEGDASGIYFALPTRLTSDKVFERMNAFLNIVLDENSVSKKSLLLHSSAWLYETEMGAEAAPGFSWFNAKKRGLLAPFAVGTIDQALMAVMNVKHNFVCAFGLAGKVVILDEVHSYDTYTGVVIDKLIDLLRDMDCTVIILSATLTDSRRKEILLQNDISIDNSEDKTSNSPYPLISYVTKNDDAANRSHITSECQLKEIPVPITDSTTVNVHYTSNDNTIFDEALLRAENGEQILWIENTVGESQDLYCRIAARAEACNIETGLLHSRFTQDDRNKNEEYWVGLYGKNGKLHRKEKGRILVGTQVLEQSIDIDADFLVTRICPSDMLLQRIGRLWRHRENDLLRPKNAKPNVCILSPEYDDALLHKKLFDKIAYVYAPYVLFRSMEVWKDTKEINIPNDIRKTVEETYIERNESGVLSKLKTQLLKEKSKLQSLARLGISRFGAPDSDTNARTRYSEIETKEVLLLREVKYLDNGNVSVVLPCDEKIFLEHGIKNVDKKEWRHRAAKLARAVVSVPSNRSPNVFVGRNLQVLNEYMWTDDLCVVIIKESDEITGLDYTNISTDYKLSYNDKIGYRAIKQKEVKDDYGDEW